MLKIKLARFGRRNQPHYRIVVNEARSKRDGEYIDLLGHYAPTQTPKVLELNMELYKQWIAKGAQPTDTVAHLAARFESGTSFPEKKATLSKKAKAKLAQAEEEKAAAATQATEETAAPAEVTEEPSSEGVAPVETTETE